MDKKFSAIAIMLFAIFGLFFAGGVEAGSEHNVSGWAWSENIGWVSFNSTTGGGGINYGVHISQDGTFTGYAWSENIGWVDFSPAGPYPDSPDYSTKANLETGEVSGWARALAYGDGWDGWIKMSGTDYGVSIDFGSGEFSGYAWSDMVIGWLSFNCANEGVCGTSDYKVMTSFSPGPTVSNLSNEFASPCAQSRIPTFSWETDADLPYDYDIRICSDADCDDELFLEEIRNTSSTSWAPACVYACDISPYNSVNFGGGTYYGQVRVRNLEGSWSSWTSDSFTTYNQAYPYPDFLCDGENCAEMEIYEEVVVGLTNNSTTYDSVLSCFWDLPEIVELVEGYTVSDCEIEITFSAPSPGQRNQDITLTVTDSSSYSCFVTKTVEIKYPLPEYKEVSPIGWLKIFFASLFTGAVNAFTGF